MSINGKYIYNLAFKAIDYCGNIEKGVTVYNEYFSPNNIRRLIISPDAVLAEFYVSVPGVGASKMVRLPSRMLSEVENLPDYMPIVQVISTSRICSSIEEIIFLVRSNDGQVTLGAKEYDLSSLVNSFQRKSKDLPETIRQRYVRLRDLVVISCSFDQFRSIQRGRDDLIGELACIRGCADVYMIHSEADWYARWGTSGAAKAYPLMDGVGGHLYNYFEKDIERRREAERKKGIEDYKRERYSEARMEFEENYEKLYRIVRMSSRFRKMVQKYGLTEGVSLDVPKVDFEALYEVDGLEKYPKTLKFPEGISLGDAYRENTKACRIMLRNLIVSASNELLRSLGYLYQNSALTAQVMLDGRKIRLIVPPEMEETADLLSEKCHCTFSCRSFSVSYQTFCYLSCLFFLNKSAQDFKSEYATAEFWEGR